MSVLASATQDFIDNGGSTMAIVIGVLFVVILIALVAGFVYAAKKSKESDKD